MPEYRSLETILNEIQRDQVADWQGRLEGITRELAIFSKRVLEVGVLCSDFTLADTFCPNPDSNKGGLMETLAALPENLRGSRFFIGDFGSFIESAGFAQNEGITREQYRPPEEFDKNLSFNAEPYQVFQLGLLFVEVLTARPGSTIDMTQFFRGDVAEKKFNEEVRVEVKAALVDSPESTVNTVCSMLSYQPELRPSLSELIDSE